MNKNVLFFLFVYAVQIPVFSQSNQPLYSAPLGVQAYTFRKSFPLNVPATLDTIKLMGFTEIEGGGGSMPPSEFKKLCDERGIRIPSIGVGYEFLNKYPDSVAGMAKQMGANFVMCAWIPHKNGLLTIQDAMKVVDDFNRIGKYLKEQGIIFCYHAHGYEFQPYENGTLLDYIINNTNPEYVSFEMDIFWIQFGGGDPVALMKKYPNRWKLMHLKDIRKGAKKDLTGLTGPENDVVLGTGEIDIPAILREANKIGIKHFFIEDESNFVNGQVPQSILYLKSLQEK
jgi:sugar phosphate isomerase/epimerase